MTTAADNPEVARLEARCEALEAENNALVRDVDALRGELAETAAGLRDEIEELRDQLAELRFISSYDMPGDVIAALEILLPGWPAARWRRLGELLEQRARSSCSGVS